LAPTQKTVLGCLAAGMDIRTTATHLSRSEHTIKSHTTAILSRLGVNSRLQAGIAGYHLVLRGELDLPRRGH
jgi:DNA-binding NarL/FixJ family response regulator